MKLKEAKSAELVQERIGKGTMRFLAGCIVGDSLYFASWLTNGFYRLDIKTGIYTFLKAFTKEQRSKNLFDQAIYYKGAVWLIPCYGEHIVRIELNSLEMTYICLPEKRIESKEGRTWKFKCCYKEGMSEFWLVPIDYNYFLKVDMETKKLEQIAIPEGTLRWEDGVINFKDACFTDNKIWFCPYEFNKLVVFDTNTGSFSFHESDFQVRRFNAIRNYKDWTIFFPERDWEYILLVNKETYEEKKIRLHVKWEKENVLKYRVFDIVDHYILAAPFFGHEFMKIDIETGEVEINTSLHEYRRRMNWESERYQVSFKYGASLIYVPDIYGSPLMIYDLKDDSVSYTEIVRDEKDYEKKLNDFYKKDKKNFLKWIDFQENPILNESDIPFSIYFLLLEDSEKRKKNTMKENTAGEVIFSQVEKSFT